MNLKTENRKQSNDSPFGKGGRGGIWRKLKTLLTHCSLLIAVLLFSSLPAWAAPGDLDTTFGTGGKVTTAIGSSGDIATALGIQSDGKIVAAGYSYNGSNYDFAVVRYMGDTVSDTTPPPAPSPLTPARRTPTLQAQP